MPGFDTTYVRLRTESGYIQAIKSKIKSIIYTFETAKPSTKLIRISTHPALLLPEAIAYKFQRIHYARAPVCPGVGTVADAELVGYFLFHQGDVKEGITFA